MREQTREYLLRLLEEELRYDDQLEEALYELLAIWEDEKAWYAVQPALNAAEEMAGEERADGLTNDTDDDD